MERAGPDVLADLLVTASEDGPETLLETDRLLRDLVGDDLVDEAHRTWTARLRKGVALGFEDEPEVVGVTSSESWNLLRRLRASRPAGRIGR